MAENYQFERSSVAASGVSNVTLVAAPPEGVSYRIFHVNAENNSGGTRTLSGDVISTSPAINVRCFEAAAFNTNVFVPQLTTTALADYPTIAILDDTDETFQILLDSTGTMRVSACYEILDQTGERTFRNAMATCNGTSDVELIPAPTSETVHRVLNVNGFNGSGASRSLYLDAGGGGTTEYLAQLFATNGNLYREHNSANQSPFPPLILSGTSDSLVMSLSGTGTNTVIANYEVLSRRVV